MAGESGFGKKRILSVQQRQGEAAKAEIPGSLLPPLRINFRASQKPPAAQPDFGQTQTSDVLLAVRLLTRRTLHFGRPLQPPPSARLQNQAVIERLNRPSVIRVKTLHNGKLLC